MQLYVGNIPFTATEQELLEHFSNYGATSVKIIRDHATGRSKGYGFIEVPEEEAQKVIDERHKTMYMGHRITVKHSRFHDKQGKQSTNTNSWKFKYLKGKY